MILAGENPRRAAGLLNDWEGTVSIFFQKPPCLFGAFVLVPARRKGKEGKGEKRTKYSKPGTWLERCSRNLPADIVEADDVFSFIFHHHEIEPAHFVLDVISWGSIASLVRD